MLRLRTLLLLLLCALALAAPAFAAHSRAEPADVDEGTQIARFAKTFVGVPYVYGGSSPRTGFDCSGLVAYVYRHFGVSLPHYTVAQFGRGRGVGRWALHPGDLVFFNGLGHVGIYVGHGKFVHAPHTGTRVRVASLGEGWYRSTYDGARRIEPA
ncbi:MAG: peptidoglycan DL-endopeptidase CwlO [Gaiellaceae bacterium]|jgi:cell wall-associated NlpC family hydrolase|nr:peptidoglycan DL-endopeptidase CwlO [Gaiellaceae bacterium]